MIFFNEEMIFGEYSQPWASLFKIPNETTFWLLLMQTVQPPKQIILNTLLQAMKKIK